MSLIDKYSAIIFVGPIFYYTTEVIMSQMSGSLQQEQMNSKKTVWFVSIFLLVVIVGLLYVKWWPYYQKAFTAATTHSIGTSILNSSESVPSWDAAWQYAIVYFKSVWKAAILGILLGSLVQVLIPIRWLLKVFGSNSFKSTAIAGFASIPGMMCTCCAAPIAVGLRKQQVSVSASLAFWIGNPMLNPATLIFMTFVLSWKFTVLRLVFGLILTFGVSYFANRFADDLSPLKVDEIVEKIEQADTSSFVSKWLRSLRNMIFYLVPTYVLSVLLLGAFRMVLFPHMGQFATSGLLAIILFAIAGMLFVIPTAAEIPIIQTFLSLGLGNGPAAALLVTLPALSLPSLLMVSKSFPKRMLIFVVLSVVVIGIVSGIVGSFLL